jgi:uncharacterized membrane protein YqaE (UPF0057 family)
MLYLLALLLPPLTFLGCGKLGQALLSAALCLTLVLWPAATLWALLAAHNHYADLRQAALIRALGRRP